MKFIERIYDGLISSPLNTVGALIIFLLALPLIRKGLRDRPPAAQPPPAPAPAPIEIESPWFVQNFLQMQDDVAKIKRTQEMLSSKIDGIASLLKRRASRKPKA